MTVRLRFPGTANQAAEALLDTLAGTPDGGDLVVGDERIMDFLAALGQKLLTPAVARQYPELGALGFFLRRRTLAAMLADPPPRAGTLRFPRGLVFHLPPANVDTVFLYSWALAALAGNRNVVRLSPRAGAAARTAVELANEVDAHPAVRQTQRVVTYGHDAAVTTVLSAACDLRVIWGGDRSVGDVRSVPLPPMARDLTFPDRSSFAVLSARGWRSAPREERRATVRGLCEDVYWFDQAACGSPRTIFWVGSAEEIEAARADLTGELAAFVAERGWRVDDAMAVHKFVTAYGLAAEGRARRIRCPSNAITHIELATGAPPPRDWLGAGAFVWASVERLLDVATLVRRRDQTVTHFGFPAEELTAFAEACGGRGVDRIVPVGQALRFSAVWDGYDLMTEFTRVTTVVPGPSGNS